MMRPSGSEARKAGDVGDGGGGKVVVAERCRDQHACESPTINNPKMVINAWASLHASIILWLKRAKLVRDSEGMLWPSSAWYENLKRCAAFDHRDDLGAEVVSRFFTSCNINYSMNNVDDASKATRRHDTAW